MLRNPRRFRAERVYGGHSYIQDNVTANQIYYRCRYKERYQCRARGIWINNVEFKSRGSHNHPAVPALPDSIQIFERELFRGVITQNRHIRLVYNDIAQQHQAAAQMLPFELVEADLRNYRQNNANVMPIVENLNNFRELLYNDEWRHLRRISNGKSYLDVTICNPGPDEGLIFSNVSLLNLLADSTLLFINFDSDHPQFDDISAVLTVTAVHKNHAVPCVFACLKGNGQRTFASVMNLVAARIDNPQQIYIDDGQIGLRMAVTNAFPNVVIVNTSLYYFAKNVLKKIEALGIQIDNENEKKIITKFMNLPLIPDQTIRASLDALIQDVQQHTNKFDRLYNYILNFWILGVGSLNFCCYSNFVSISNVNRSVETLIRNSVAGGRTSIWSFLEFFQSTFSSGISSINVLNTNNRRNVTSPSIHPLIHRQSIYHHWKLFRNDNDFTGLEFLDFICFSSEEYVNLLIFNIPILRANPFLLPGELNNVQINEVVEEAQAIDAPPNVEHNDAVTCIVCFDEEREYMVNPCRHFILCGTCALRVENENIGAIRCPYCGSESTDIIRIFSPKM